MSVQLVVATVVAPSVSTPLAAPKPNPVTVTVRVSPVVFLRTYGRSTASSWGLPAPRSHWVGLATVVSGARAVAATWVGASSVTV